MYDIRIKESVLQDLDEISEYIFRTSFSIELANKIYDKIMASIISLKIFPYSFPIFENNFRVMTINKNYRVFYQVNEKSKIITIQYIFGTSENYNNLIR